jgi:Holliday junction resolvasome RuvABC ATP-dependent DNA helicase subunit
MEKFLGSNPGLRSRFPRVVSFPDYSTEELGEIFGREANRNQYRITDEAQTALKGEIEHLWQARGPDFANARVVRNLFERVISMQANRLSRSSTITSEMLSTVTVDDVWLAFTRPVLQPTVSRLSDP